MRQRSDFLILSIGNFFLAMFLIGAWQEWIEGTFAQTAILAGTASIILWYTVETMRLRREAEDRAKRDREPHIAFDVIQPSEFQLPMLQEGWPATFKLTNHSANSALGRVRVRLRMDSQAEGFSPNPAYNGKQIWEITPFFQISGFFDVLEVIREAQPGRPYPPAGNINLNVQLDLYFPDRSHCTTLRKEYHIGIVPPRNVLVQFWPEVSASLPPLDYPEELPDT